MTDYKQLCAELVDDLELCDWPPKLKEIIRADIDRARAALAESEPSVDDVLLLAAIIREVDGTNRSSASRLAEDILSHPASRWGNHPGSPDRSGNLKAGLTRSPVAGEVAELARLMREEVSELRAGGHLTPDERLRAADLLERLSPPQPMPVSERLPLPGDCEDEGWAWFFNKRIGWRQAVLPVSPGFTHWLPAHALPLPTSGEEES